MFFSPRSKPSWSLTQKAAIVTRDNCWWWKGGWEWWKGGKIRFGSRNCWIEACNDRSKKKGVQCQYYWTAGLLWDRRSESNRSRRMDPGRWTRETMWSGDDGRIRWSIPTWRLLRPDLDGRLQTLRRNREQSEFAQTLHRLKCRACLRGIHRKVWRQWQHRVYGISVRHWLYPQNYRFEFVQKGLQALLLNKHRFCTRYTATTQWGTQTLIANVHAKQSASETLATLATFVWITLEVAELENHILATRAYP